VSVSAESPEEVESMIAKAVEAGGKKGPNMLPDGGEYGMYSRTVVDPDGHVFEVVYFNEKAQAQAHKGEKAEP